MSPRRKATPTPNPKVCPTCQQPHERCTAHNRQGTPCRRWPIHGGWVCGMHGGKAPHVKQAAEKRVIEAEAAAAVAKFGLLRDIAPADALLEEVQRAANMVDYYAQAIRRADPDTDPDVLTYGLKHRIEKVNGETSTSEEKWTSAPTVLVDLWMRERAHYAQVAAAAARAGAELNASDGGALVVQVSWPAANPAGQPTALAIDPNPDRPRPSTSRKDTP